MHYLLITSLLWAMSFGLVKGQLHGVDSVAIAVVRLGIAMVVFLPLLRPARVDWRTMARLAGIGALQFGVMYVLYLKSFAYLPAYQIALFTVFTPLYVVVLDALMERSWSWKYLLAALLAAAGAAIVLDFRKLGMGHLHGFLLLQGSNLCFAAGQLFWRREHKRLIGRATDAQIFSVTYLGAFVLSLGASFLMTDWGAFTLTRTQWLSVVYLGAIASGLCFFLWNVGAEKVNAGTLAVMNNAKIPIAIVVMLVVFGEQADWLHLLGGGLVIGLAMALTMRGKASVPVHVAAPAPTPSPAAGSVDGADATPGRTPTRD